VSLVACPLTRDQARAFLRHHRHNKTLTGYRFAFGCETGGALAGVCTVGRPRARLIDQYAHVEVSRLCTTGTPNVCSFLYSKASRVARELGFRSIFTSILETELGVSLRAAGWVHVYTTRGGSQDRPSRRREDKTPICPKHVYAPMWCADVVATLNHDQARKMVAEGLANGRRWTPTLAPKPVTLTDLRTDRVAIDRFWLKVNKDGAVPEHCSELGHCWIWTGFKEHSGYGKFRIDGRMALAHRVSLAIATGERPPPERQACHRCDNPSCVNPAHLFWGTNTDNLKDAQRKGRLSGLNAGVRNANTKLTEAQVIEIIGSAERITDLARRYGVGFTCIKNIRRGNTWRHLERRGATHE
jgi:hypothetical protein